MEAQCDGYTVPQLGTADAYYLDGKLIQLTIHFKDTMSWNQALQKVGLSVAGVKAMNDRFDNIHITGVEGLPIACKIVFVQKHFSNFRLVKFQMMPSLGGIHKLQRRQKALSESQIFRSLLTQRPSTAV